MRCCLFIIDSILPWVLVVFIGCDGVCLGYWGQAVVAVLPVSSMYSACACAGLITALGLVVHTIYETVTTAVVLLVHSARFY